MTRNRCRDELRDRTPCLCLEARRGRSDFADRSIDRYVEGCSACLGQKIEDAAVARGDRRCPSDDSPIRKIRELRKPNEMLKSATTFCGKAEFDRACQKDCVSLLVS